MHFGSPLSDTQGTSTMSDLLSWALSKDVCRAENCTTGKIDMSDPGPLKVGLGSGSRLWGTREPSGHAPPLQVSPSFLHDPQLEPDEFVSFKYGAGCFYDAKFDCSSESAAAGARRPGHAIS